VFTLYAILSLSLPPADAFFLTYPSTPILPLFRFWHCPAPGRHWWLLLSPENSFLFSYFPPFLPPPPLFFATRAFSSISSQAAHVHLRIRISGRSSPLLFFPHLACSLPQIFWTFPVIRWFITSVCPMNPCHTCVRAGNLAHVVFLPLSFFM